MRQKLLYLCVQVGLFMAPLAHSLLQDTLETDRYDKGNRYEGTSVPIQAGDLSLEIVSFTSRLDSFEHNSSLKVKFFMPPGETDAGIFPKSLPSKSSIS